MKLLRYMCLATIVLAVPACDRFKNAEPTPVAEAPKQAQSAKPSGPMDARQIEQFKVTFEQAMGEIPPELRQDFQRLFSCEIERNKKLPADQQRVIDGAAVREMTATLKTNRSAANCT